MPDVKEHVRRGSHESDAPEARKRRLTAAESTTMTARVPSTLAATFDAIGLITGMSVGAIQRVALEEYLVKHWSPERLATDLAAARQAQEAAQAKADELAAVGMIEAVERVDIES